MVIVYISSKKPFIVLVIYGQLFLWTWSKFSFNFLESCNIKSLPEKNIPKTQSSKAICLGILGDTLVTMERSVRDGENVDRLLKTTDHVSDIENIVGNDIVDSAAESFIDKNFGNM